MLLGGGFGDFHVGELILADGANRVGIDSNGKSDEGNSGGGVLEEIRTTGPQKSGTGVRVPVVVGRVEAEEVQMTWLIVLIRPYMRDRKREQEGLQRVEQLN